MMASCLVVWLGLLRMFQQDLTEGTLKPFLCGCFHPFLSDVWSQNSNEFANSEMVFRMAHQPQRWVFVLHKELQIPEPRNPTRDTQRWNDKHGESPSFKGYYLDWIWNGNPTLSAKWKVKLFPPTQILVLRKTYWNLLHNGVNLMKYQGCSKVTRLIHGYLLGYIDPVHP